MYSVTLSACGNPDHKENPYSNIVNGIAVEKDIAVWKQFTGYFRDKMFPALR